MNPFFEITLPVKPRAKARPRATSRGTVYTPKETVSAEREIGLFLKLNAAPLFEGALSLTVTFFFLKPKTAPKTRRHPTQGPDLDNLVKLVSDAGNKILWRDDRQIVRIEAFKAYGDEEKINLRVEEIAAPRLIARRKIKRKNDK